MAKNKKSQYRKELEARVKPMMQKANMMLLNLETLSKQEGFEGVKDFAYYNAMRDIRQLRGEEFKRFNIPKNTHQLEKVERSLEKFLGSTTSTKAGIVEVYEKNASYLNEQFGSNMSWQDMGNFLRSAGFEELKKEYDSETAIIMLKALYEHKDISKEKFKEMLSNHQIKTKWKNTNTGEVGKLDEVDSKTLSDFVDTNMTWEELFPTED